MLEWHPDLGRAFEKRILASPVETLGARALGGPDRARKLKSGDGVDRPVTEPFQRVEMDAHPLDARFCVSLPHPAGGHLERIIHRLWVIVIVEVMSRAVLGYHLSLRREVSHEDVLRTLKRALGPWGRRPLSFDPDQAAYLERRPAATGRGAGLGGRDDTRPLAADDREDRLRGSHAETDGAVMRPARPCPVVNWGRGRLVPHESIGGFAAKFCELNGLKAHEFRAFLDRQLGFGAWSRAGFEGHATRRAAQLLGEPPAVVCTLGMEAWRLPACFGTFRLERPDPLPGLVRFCPACPACPACLADGYHAGFHEPVWLHRCLLHALPLESRWVSGQRAATGIDAYVQTLRELLSSGAASGALSLRSRPGLLGAMRRERFQCARRWLQAARRLRGRLAGANLIAARGGDYAPGDLGLLLGRLAYHLPLPASLAGSARATVVAAHPTLVRAYPSEVVREFQALFPPGHPEAFELFGGFLRKTDALTEAEPDHRRQALAVAADWAADHADCRCAWGQGRDGRWLGHAPSRWDPPDMPCPVRVAIDELRGEWLDFVLAGASARERREAQQGYFRAFEVYAARRWVGRVSGDAGAGPPEEGLARQLRWNLGEPLRRLVLDILHEGFLHHVAELEIWRGPGWPGRPPATCSWTIRAAAPRCWCAGRFARPPRGWGSPPPPVRSQAMPHRGPGLRRRSPPDFRREISHVRPSNNFLRKPVTVF